MNKKIVCVHLDLKGVMFKPEYIPHLLEDLAGQRVNSVLVEYEDRFPFKSVDIVEEPEAVWENSLLRSFLVEASCRHIEVIPLMQCLGHLEYLLKWERYRSFAEKKEYPSTICLSNPRAKKLVLSMLREIMEAHPDGRYIHLGMDEAHLACCPKCSRRGDIISLFCGWMEELCDAVEAFGKTPIIWADMLENNYRPKDFSRIRERVVLCTWDYGTVAKTNPVARLGGLHIRRSWLGHPEDPAAPAIGATTSFYENCPRELRRVIRPYERGQSFQSLFQMDLWRKHGFRVIGASAIRASSHGAVVPRYNHLRNNIKQWSETVAQTGALGLIATSWERGTSWCPPNFNIDLTWPLIGDMTRSMGAKPAPFWPGIPEKTVSRIISQLGRCREDWRIENVLADEMDALAPLLRAHHHEWRSISLMARVLHLHRRIENAMLEVDFFDANCRPVDSEWKRRIDDQSVILREIRKLRKCVRTHFGKRYHGAAFEEWLRELFDIHVKRLENAGGICREKLCSAKMKYGKS